MAQDTLLGFPAHTLPYRRGEFTTLLTVSGITELCLFFTIIFPFDEKRLKETILEIIQQADLILLGLCCAASVFGIAMIYSATRYNNDNRKIIVQTAALLIGIVAACVMSVMFYPMANMEMKGLPFAVLSLDEGVETP